MKIKRILGIFIALAMTMPIFLTGCQNEADDLESNTSIRQNIVLNMYILTEEETDPEQATAVELAINEILLPDYRTVLKINYISDEDEYWAAIDAAEAEAIEYQERLEAEAEAAKEAAKEANKNGGVGASADEEEEPDQEELEKENESEYDRLVNMVYGKAGDPENGIEAIEPEIILDNPQLDIFVVNDAKKYSELVSAGRLAPLDSYLTSESKVLNSYVYPTFLTGAKLGGSVTYGIPVNKAIGEYEYLVFDKELLDKYNVSSEDMKTFESLNDYLALIAANEPGVVPLALSEGADPQFFEYYDVEGGAIGLPSNQIFRSAFGSYADTVVKEHFITVRNYRVAGYIPDVYTEGTRFAVDIRKGYAYSPEEWMAEDGREYEYQVYKKPIATNNNTLNSIFVVSSASRNPQRAAEIITVFNTVPELANMLQYGIEGTNYYSVTDTDGEKKVKLPENNAGAGYYMNNDYTGNHYIKMVLEGETNHTDDSKKQNSDSIISLYYGFEPSLYIEDELLLEKANQIALSYYPGLCRGDDDVETVYADINNRLSALSVTEAEIDAWVAESPANEKRYEDELAAKAEESENADGAVVEEAVEEADTDEEPVDEEITEENAENEDTEAAADEETGDTEAEQEAEPEEEFVAPEREGAGEDSGDTATSPFDQLLAKINDQFDSYYESASDAHHSLWSVSSNNFNKNNGNNVSETKVISDLKKLVEED